MSNNPLLSEQVAEARLRSNEIEIDVLVSHELATQSAAGRLFWERLGQPQPEEPPRIERQRRRQRDGRTTDVAVDAPDGRTLLIEDKGTGGHFEPDQVESYEDEREHSTDLWTVLVAPEEFLRVNKEEASPFSLKLSLEELAECLETAAADLPSGELQLSYRYRAHLFREAAKRRRTSVTPDEAVAAFGTNYQAFVEQASSGRLVAHHIGSKMNRIVGFDPVGQFELCHQLGSKRTGTGLVDCQVNGMSFDELVALVEGAPPTARLPHGFYPDKKGSGSALRCEVPFIADEDTPLPPFEETEPVVAETVRHMLNLAVWLEDGGAQLFARPEAAIRHHFAAIATLAQRAGRNDLAKTASDLANTVHI